MYRALSYLKSFLNCERQHCIFSFKLWLLLKKIPRVGSTVDSKVGCLEVWGGGWPLGNLLLQLGLCKWPKIMMPSQHLLLPTRAPWIKGQSFHMPGRQQQMLITNKWNHDYAQFLNSVLQNKIILEILKRKHHGYSFLFLTNDNWVIEKMRFLFLILHFDSRKWGWLCAQKIPHPLTTLHFKKLSLLLIPAHIDSVPGSLWASAVRRKGLWGLCLGRVGMNLDPTLLAVLDVKDRIGSYCSSPAKKYPGIGEA